MLDSDEDEIDENGAQYLEKLEKSIHNKSNGGLTIEVHTNLNYVFLVLNYILNTTMAITRFNLISM